MSLVHCGKLLSTMVLICMVMFYLIRVVIEDEVISEQADCYKETDTTDGRRTSKDKEEELIQEGESISFSFSFSFSCRVL